MDANIEINFYYNQNRENFLKLKQVFEKYPNQYGAVICNRGSFEKAENLQYLCEWVYNVVQFLTNDTAHTHRLAEYVYCILNGITEFPKCKNRNCSNVLDHSFVNAKRGYLNYCSTKCSSSDEFTHRKAEATNLRLYGNTFGADRAKISATKRKHAAEDPLYWTRQKDKARQTNVKNGHPPNWNNSEQAVKTQRQKNGGKYRSEDEIQQIKNTNLERYGYESSNSAPSVKEKKRQKNIELYGTEYYFQSDEFKAKSLRYYEKLGVTNCMQLHGVQLKMHRKYVFNGIKFDSKPELAMYIWLTDNSFLFEFHPDLCFNYEFNGVQHKYFPDFLISINDKTFIVEIKGGLFFRKDGTMFCPFRNKKWTDEQYDARCRLEECKHQCMIANSVHIIKDTSLCIAIVMDYINKKYGRNYLEQFKSKRKRIISI